MPSPPRSFEDATMIALLFLFGLFFIPWLVLRCMEHARKSEAERIQRELDKH
jgi:hypothetical protein